MPFPIFPQSRSGWPARAYFQHARGAVTRTRTLREVIRGNVAVLGDASGSVDAITGEGLLSAFRQAHALADAIAAGKPERYAAAHRQIAKESTAHGAAAAAARPLSVAGEALYRYDGETA